MNHSNPPILLCRQAWRNRRTLYGRHTCSSDMIALGRILNNLSVLTSDIRETYLFKWFDRTWQELKFSFQSLRQTYFYNWFDHACLEQWIIPFWPMFLGTLYRWFDNTWQEINLLFHSDLCSKAFILVQVIWSHLALTKCIPFEPMLLGRHTCTSDSITLRRNLMNPFISDLNTLYRNLMYHSIWQTHLGRHTCTSDLFSLDRNLMYHSLISNAFRQTYLGTWIDYSWK